MKACGTLLMALIDKHQLKFNSHKVAKILMEAIKKRFGGNTKTKKVQKTLLKQQFKNFTGSSSEGLDQIHDRLQNLTHTLIWKNKADLEEQSLDDLFNSPKIYKTDVKQSSSTSTALQNLAFVSLSHNDSTTDSVSAVDSVFAACAKLPASPLPNVDSLSNATGRNLGANGPTSVGFDISKVECYNCYMKGHFSRECRSPKDPRRPGAAKPQRKTVPVETSTSNALVTQCDGTGSYDWSYKAEEEPINFALMAFSSSSSSNNELSPTKHVQDLSYTTRPSVPIIKDWPSNSENESKPKAPQFIPSFTQSSKHVKSPSHTDQQLETTIPAATGKRRNKKACFVCKSMDHLINDCDFHTKKMAQPTQRNYAYRGHHRQYAPLTHSKPQKHMVLTAVLTQSKPVFNTVVRLVSAALPSITMTRPRYAHHVVTKSKSPIIKHITHSPSSKTSNSPPRVTAVQAPVVSAAQGKQGTWGNPQQALKDNGVIDSGRSRHMTGNMSYLFKFKELNGGYVTFRGNPKGGNNTGKGKIKKGKLDFDDVYFVKELKFNLFSVLQMCNKKNRVLFTDTECLVLSPDFKMPNESQVLLRVPRENSMYNVNLKNIVPSGDLTCLFAKQQLNSYYSRDLHVNFLENKPTVAGTGPTWLFDIDSLTRTMNYQPVTARNQTKSVAGSQDKFAAEKAREEVDQTYVLFPMWSVGFINPQNNDEDAAFDGKEHDFDAKKPESVVILSSRSSAQSRKQDDQTKKENKRKSPVESFTGYRDLNAEFEDCFDNGSNEVNAAGSIVPTVGKNSLNSTNTFCTIGPSNTAVSPTYGKSYFIDTSKLPDDPDMPKLEDITYSDDEDVKEPKRVHQALKDPSWIEAMQKELLQFKMQKVWVFVDLPYGKRAIGLQVKQNKDGIFISKDKHVAKILRKFGLTDEKLASTPIDTKKPLLKDRDGEDVDVHTYMLIIGSLMYLTSSRPDIMFVVCACTRFQVTPKASHLHAVKRIFRYLKVKPHLGLWYPKDSPFDLVAYSNSDYAGASLDIKSTTGGCQFLGCRLISWQCKKQIVFATSSIEAEYVAAASYVLKCYGFRINCWIMGRKFNFSKYIFESLVRNVDSTSKIYMYPQFIQLLIRNQLGDLSTHTTKYTSPALTQKVQDVADDAAAQGANTAVQGDDAQEPSLDACSALTRRVKHLRYDKMAQALEISKLKQRVKKLEKGNKVNVLKLRRLKKVGTSQRIDTSDDTVMEDASNQGRMIDDLDKDDVVALMDDKEEKKKEKEVKDDHVQGRQAEIYKIDMNHGLKVLSMQEDKPAEVQEVVDVVTTGKLITEVVTATSESVTAASTTIYVAKLQVPAATTIAVQVRVAAASTRRKKGVVIKNPEEESTTIIPADTKSKDKGKGIMVEQSKPLKNKKQVEMDKEYARKLHEEVNKDIDWPQTEAQARKNMIMYLKNVDGFRLDYFKGMSYDDINLIFEAKFNSNIEFLLKTTEQLKEEESRAIQSINTRWISSSLKESKDYPWSSKVERRYPLSRFTLEQMLNAVRLRVEEHSEMSLELLSFRVDVAMDLEEKHKVFNAAGEEFSAAKQKLMLLD
nr:hypothetical protein [Tanacetum cinerariifolium]